MIAGALEKLGIGSTALTRGRYADLLLSTQPLSPEARASACATRCSGIYRQFVERVAEGRGLDAGEGERGGTRSRLDRRARRRRSGSSTTLGGLREAVLEAKALAGLAPDADVVLVPFPPPKPLVEQVREAVEGSASRCAARLSRRSCCRAARARPSLRCAPCPGRARADPSRLRGGALMRLVKEFEVQRPRADAVAVVADGRDARRPLPRQRDRDRRDARRAEDRALALPRPRARGRGDLPLHLPPRRRRRLREGVRRARLAPARRPALLRGLRQGRDARAHRDGRQDEGARARVHHQGPDAGADRADGRRPAPRIEGASAR